jgi:hypothetical protein
MTDDGGYSSFFFLYQQQQPLVRKMASSLSLGSQQLPSTPNMNQLPIQFQQQQQQSRTPNGFQPSSYPIVSGLDNSVDGTSLEAEMRQGMGMGMGMEMGSGIGLDGLNGSAGGSVAASVSEIPSWNTMVNQGRMRKLSKASLIDTFDLHQMQQEQYHQQQTQQQQGQALLNGERLMDGGNSEVFASQQQQQQVMGLGYRIPQQQQQQPPLIFMEQFPNGNLLNGRNNGSNMATNAAPSFSTNSLGRTSGNRVVSTGSIPAGMVVAATRNSSGSGTPKSKDLRLDTTPVMQHQQKVLLNEQNWLSPSPFSSSSTSGSGAGSNGVVSNGIGGMGGLGGIPGMLEFHQLKSPSLSPESEVGSSVLGGVGGSLSVLQSPGSGDGFEQSNVSESVGTDRFQQSLHQQNSQQQHQDHQQNGDSGSFATSGGSNLVSSWADLLRRGSLSTDLEAVQQQQQQQQQQQSALLSNSLPSTTTTINGGGLIGGALLTTLPSTVGYVAQNHSTWGTVDHSGTYNGGFTDISTSIIDGTNFNNAHFNHIANQTTPNNINHHNNNNNSNSNNNSNGNGNLTAAASSGSATATFNGSNGHRRASGGLASSVTTSWGNHGHAHSHVQGHGHVNVHAQGHGHGHVLGHGHGHHTSSHHGSHLGLHTYTNHTHLNGHSHSHNHNQGHAHAVHSHTHAHGGLASANGHHNSSTTTNGNTANINGNNGNISMNPINMLPPKMLKSKDPLKPGDWICPNGNCRYHNFARRTTCVACGTSDSRAGRF